ncbi:hypothetical protein E5163_10255 [Marinicauda algicola]|uniref:Uncharacterized protein n=1 Tax=Marinicauda algicola TaxID=2029849 RepID=A0A4S2GYG1_9PROT|nr:DUF5676 family membrane protein [Marinicauda algicola]TGY88205.1 hypothetical protein E5163_10255 [Marinicauda algicola]
MNTPVPARPLSIKVTGLALSAFLLVSYLLCVGFGLVMPARFHMHEAWAPLLPGFEWLTWPGFVFGAIGAYLYGWYIAVVFVPLWRFFAKRA